LKVSPIPTEHVAPWPRERIASLDAGHRNADPADHVLADFLTEQQLAEQLGLTPRTLWRWRRERRGPDYTLAGRRIVYSRESVRRWLLQRERRMVREGRSRA
jgi:hypothetical protein